jgi:hypothetical protein
MKTDTVLTDIASTAASLVAQKTLRSKAVLLQRLMPLIDEAIRLGHKHEAIHSAIEGAGVELTFGSYRNTLHRLRTRNAAGAITPAAPGIERVSAAVGSQEPKPFGSQEPIEGGSQEPKSESAGIKSASRVADEKPQSEVRAGDAFAVRDALKQAQATSKTDYRKFAKGNPK